MNILEHRPPRRQQACVGMDNDGEVSPPTLTVEVAIPDDNQDGSSIERKSE